MTAKPADIDVAAVKCTPAELTITWQNSSYSVYSSLWLRDNAPAHRDAQYRSAPDKPGRSSPGTTASLC